MLQPQNARPRQAALALNTRRVARLGALAALLLAPAALAGPPAVHADHRPAVAEVVTPGAPAVSAPLGARDLLAAGDVVLTLPLMQAVGLTPAVAAATLADPTARRYPRQRALWALALYGGAEARAQVRAVAEADRDPEVQVEAALVLARGFAAQGDAQAHADLARLAERAEGKLKILVAAERARLAAPR